MDLHLELHQKCSTNFPFVYWYSVYFDEIISIAFIIS